MDESQLKRIQELRNMAALPKREIVGINVEPPQRVYFYQMNEPVAVLWKDAKNIHGKFPYLGTSAGLKYWEAVQEADALFRQHGKELAIERIKLGIQEELEEAKKDLTPPQWKDIIEPRGETGFFGF